MLSDAYFLAEAEELMGTDLVTLSQALKRMYVDGRNSVVGACGLRGGIDLAAQVTTALAACDEMDTVFADEPTSDIVRPS